MSERRSPAAEVPGGTGAAWGDEGGASWSLWGSCPRDVRICHHETAAVMGQKVQPPFALLASSLFEVPKEVHGFLVSPIQKWPRWGLGMCSLILWDGLRFLENVTVGSLEVLLNTKSWRPLEVRVEAA